MLRRPYSRRQEPRRGAACVELALLLPLLGFLLVIAIDYSRVFYHNLTVMNCARNGALYASQDDAASVDTAGIQAAALADASDLSPTPTVTSKTGTTVYGEPYVEVTVTYTFQTITSFPGVPSDTTLVRTVRMRVSPMTPKSVGTPTS